MASSSSYVKHECIGRGSFGYVFRGTEKSTGRECALKLVDLEVVTDEIEVIQREIKVMSQISNPGVVQYYASFMEGSTLWIVMEFLAGGSLKELLDAVRVLPEDAIAAVMRSLMRGLDYLHKGGKLHRDIKSANILLSSDGAVKLADFGVAAQVTATIRQRNTFVGTPFYMAPEVIKESAYNEKADIWSIGITAIELATGLPPHAAEDQSKEQCFRAILLIPKSDPPRLEGEFSKSFKSFVEACLQKNPADRASAEQLIGHPFIKKARSSSIRGAIRRKCAVDGFGNLAIGIGVNEVRNDGIAANSVGSRDGLASPSLHLSVDSSLASSAVGGGGVGGATVGARPGDSKPSMWDFDSVEGPAVDAPGHRKCPSRLLTDIPDVLEKGPSSSSGGLGSGPSGASAMPTATTTAQLILEPREKNQSEEDSDATLSPIEVDVESITVAPASRVPVPATTPNGDSAVASSPTVHHPPSSSLPVADSGKSRLENDALSQSGLSEGSAIKDALLTGLLPAINGGKAIPSPHLPTPPAPPVEESRPSSMLSDLVLPVISDMRADVATAGVEDEGLQSALGHMEVAFADAETSRPGITATLIESLIKEILATQSREVRTILMRALHHHEKKEQRG